MYPENIINLAGAWLDIQRNGQTFSLTPKHTFARLKEVKSSFFFLHHICEAAI